MKNGKMFMLVVIVLAIAVLACDFGGGGGQPSEEAPVAPAPSGGEGGEETTSEEGASSALSGGEGGEEAAEEDASSAPSGGEAGEEAAEEDASSAPPSTEQDLSLSTLTGGLALLESYESTFTLRFVGKDEQGQPVDVSMETREEFTQEPRAQRLTVISSGLSPEEVDQGGTFEITTIGDTTYMVTQGPDGQTSCIAMSTSEDTPPQQGMFSPDMMGGVSGAKYAGKETVNGVKAKKYTWKEGGLAGLGFTSAQGVLWVAEDGNYVAKYTAEATGKGVFFAPTQEEGTVTIEYNVYQGVSGLQIEPPADCAAPATDIPIMADAQDETIFGEMLTYTSPSVFAEVVEFHNTEMPNSGWQPSGEPAEMEGFATLEFVKDDRKAQVMITYDPDEELTSVIVTTSEE